jgi:hypothetical protein
MTDRRADKRLGASGSDPEECPAAVEGMGKKTKREQSRDAEEGIERIAAEEAYRSSEETGVL